MTNGLTLEDLLQDLEPDTLDKEASENEVTTEEIIEDSSISSELESILTKEAGEADAESTETVITSEEESTEMNKEAQDLGVKLAQGIINTLEKSANEVQTKTDSLVADQDSETERTPEGKVNEVLKAVIDRGIAGGATCDKDEAEGKEVAQEGKASKDCGEQPVSADIEKSAAVSHLVAEEDMSFEDAVSLVKQAEEEILSEEVEHVKVAAVNALITEHGFGIEDAVAAVSAEFSEDNASNEE